MKWSASAEELMRELLTYDDATVSDVLTRLSDAVGEQHVPGFDVDRHLMMVGLGVLDQQRCTSDRLRRVVSRAVGYISVVDSDLKLVAISPALAQLLGWPPPELIGRSFLPLVVDLGQAQRGMEQLVRDGAREAVAHLRTRDGELVHLAYRSREIACDGRTLYLSEGEPVDGEPPVSENGAPG